CDKLRFEALDNGALFENAPELKIRIGFDTAARTITVADNGIGMSAEEVVSHLGTIAKSGTKEFFGRLTGDRQKDANLIGQFGVGFYSAFIVADRVTVETRRAGQPPEAGVRWSCSMSGDAAGEYSTEQIEKADRGTTITLHLREDQEDLLSGWQLRSLIRKYSDHIVQPIVMKKEEWDQEKGEQVITEEDETVNQASALWAKPRNDITDDEYKAFYKHVGHDYDEPAMWTHN